MHFYSVFGVQNRLPNIKKFIKALYQVKFMTYTTVHILVDFEVFNKKDHLIGSLKA